MGPTHPAPPAVRITVNGQPEEILPGMTLADLVRRHGLEGRACAAEVNRRLVTRRDHPTTTLACGDTVELVTLVGGG